MGRLSPFLLPGGSASDRANVRTAWGMVGQDARARVLRRGIRARLLGRGERYCDVSSLDIGPSHETAWGLFVREDCRVYFAPGVTVATACHEIGHAIDYTYGLGRLFASEAPAYTRHVATLGRDLNSYAATDAQEHFAEAWRVWCGANDGLALHHPDRVATRADLRATDATTCEVIDTIQATGVWPIGHLTWPDLTVSRRTL